MCVNRRIDEDFLSYVDRFWNEKKPWSDFNCYGLIEQSVKKYSDMNACIKTFDHTYYFSISSGFSANAYGKQREVFSEPAKATKEGLGFNIDAKDNIEKMNKIVKLKRKISKV